MSFPTRRLLFGGKGGRGARDNDNPGGSVLFPLHCDCPELTNAACFLVPVTAAPDGRDGTGRGCDKRQVRFMALSLAGVLFQRSRVVRKVLVDDLKVRCEV